MRGSSLGNGGILSTKPRAQEQEDKTPPFTGLQTSGVCGVQKNPRDRSSLPAPSHRRLQTPLGAGAGLQNLEICISPSSDTVAQALW